MLILVLGGTSSGKSDAAEKIAAGFGPAVTYVATLVPDASDADLQRRIDAHQRRRADAWTTVDAGADLAGQLRAITGTVLLDGLGAWVALHQPDDATSRSLVEAMQQRADHTVVVSDEVGMSVHPQSADGRAFQAAIGRVNQRVAEVADRTLVVVAGRVLTTEALDVATLIPGEA